LGKMAEIKCTEEGIDAIVGRMEASLAKVEELQGSMVKLKKAEMDLLKAFEEARDYMMKMLKQESRETLQNIFGGDCKRIASIGNCLKSAVFADKGTKDDQRIAGCQSACESVEKVLEDLGLGWALRQAQEQAKAKKGRKSEVITPAVVEQVLEAVIEPVIIEPVVIEEPPPKPEPPSKKDMVSAALDKTIDENLIDRILACTEAAQLAEFGPLEKNDSLGNWMIWMVHRAYLDDPTLAIFDFTNLQMPPAGDEPRIAPKLMKAIATNTHIEKLLLPNSNLQTGETGVLAESLTQNGSLKVLNVDSNFIASGEMESLANSFGINQSLEEVRVNNQRGLKFGNSHYEAFKKAVEANRFLCKLGLSIDVPHFRDHIDRQVMRNNDEARKRRVAAKKAAEGGGGYA